MAEEEKGPFPKSEPSNENLRPLGKRVIDYDQVACILNRVLPVAFAPGNLETVSRGQINLLAIELVASAFTCFNAN